MKQAEVNLKIQATEARALDFYEEINRTVKNDFDAARGLLKLALTQLLTSSKNTILKNFENQMYSIDSIIKKEDIMEEAN